ncbi:MAG: hypothetical protein AABX70_07930 [Nanoarchaeota archaeon]
MDLNSIQAVRTRRCNVERFWGQTIIYVSATVGRRIGGQEKLRELVMETFGTEAVQREKQMGKRYRTVSYVRNRQDIPECYLIETPSVLKEGIPPDQNPDFGKPDTLVERIMDCYQSP